MARIYSYKNKNGKLSWFVDYSYNGVRFRKKIGSSKKLAELSLKEIEVEIAKGTFKEKPSEVKIKDCFDSFIEYSSVNHKSSSLTRYQNIINNFSKFLELKKQIVYLNDLYPKLFEDYKIFRRKTPLNKGIVAKTNTVNTEIVTLRSIFNYAIQWNLLSENPTNGVKRLKVTDSKKYRFLTTEEIRVLLDNCKSDIYPIFYTFIYTGMRMGELLNLMWDDVSIQRKAIIIQAKEFWSPKSGERTIPMNQGVCDIFKKLESKSKRKKFVFEGKTGGQLKIKLRDRLITLTKKCGFPDVTKIHSLRHTFASHLVMRGVDLPSVQKLLGHADIQTTMIYAHLAPDHLVDAVNKLNVE